MQTEQFSLSDFGDLLRRRKKYIVIPLILITLLGVIGAFTLPRRYESTTTILFQRDEATNPLIRFALEQTNPQLLFSPTEDRFRTFTDIIYSHRTLQTLVDTLGLASAARSEADLQSVIKLAKERIATEKRGPETFTISYTDGSPFQAQRGASLVARLFIKTSLEVDNQRNELAVDFFQKKLDELKQKFESSQKERVSELKSQIGEVPAEDRLLQDKMEDVDRRMNDLDLRVQSYRQSLATLHTFPEAFGTERGKQGLFELERADLPFAGELHALRLKYDDYMRRYTPRYPEVQVVREQIMDLLGKMRGAVDNEIAKLQGQRRQMESERMRAVEDLKRTNVMQHADQEKESNYTIYRQMYDEMKVKLEQAQAARELGSRGGNQFTIIDPALVPTEPSKPNRPLLIGAGVGFGLFIGLIAAILAELLDATVRTTRDIEIFQKPIIAFIPEGRRQLPG